MSYDAGPYTFSDTRNSDSTAYNPTEAYQAYKAIYKSGAINLGIEVPPEAWGGNVVTAEAIKEMAFGMGNDEDDGMFVWSIQKKSNAN